MISDYVGCDCSAVHLRSSVDHSITHLYYSYFYFDKDSQSYKFKSRKEQDNDYDKEQENVRDSIYDSKHPKHAEVMDDMINRHMKENKEELVMTFGSRPEGQWILSHIPETDMFTFVVNVRF